MRVTTINATIRYSQDTGKGSWKSLELGAEADLGPNEDWHTGQQELYRQLGARMRVLWANGTGKTDHQETPPSKREHWCETHQTEFKKFTKDGRVWYSHQAHDGKWCKKQ
jgi:hypothetical protein